MAKDYKNEEITANLSAYYSLNPSLSRNLYLADSYNAVTVRHDLYTGLLKCGLQPVNLSHQRRRILRQLFIHNHFVQCQILESFKEHRGCSFPRITLYLEKGYDKHGYDVVSHHLCTL